MLCQKYIKEQILSSFVMKLFFHWVVPDIPASNKYNFCIKLLKKQQIYFSFSRLPKIQQTCLLNSSDFIFYQGSAKHELPFLKIFGPKCISVFPLADSVSVVLSLDTQPFHTGRYIQLTSVLTKA